MMINIFTRLTLISAVLVSTQAFAWNNDMTLQNTKQLTLDAQSLTALKVEAGSGFLNIVGSDTTAITVKAEIYQYEAHDNYCLNLANKGTTAQLTANNCNSNNDQQTRIDLTVALPKTFSLNITDGSGAILIENTAATKIHDGSGAINVDTIKGDLIIEDGSGGITVNNVSGTVDIHDGSGSIDLTNTLSDVKVHDGSGNINIENVDGDVSVTDGSGGIYVDTAASFTLVADGSGRVKIKNVQKQTL
ncbi:hypothetical protein HJP15_00865 [Pseudoalteromonas sp. NEC-BIFX-2020_002]|uniref:hypothetical protein n=1 Tax=Pseudoalteromonas sp. NEC-BIFX-2020_002 TaxID=2732353 RepID=UPI0014769BBD|nr:hypothetical protein [Pseudoalteromonas sp. NEC-BIFX-2020_002]NNG41504.1 hypothetical protein [Pseudoalteromonas sp. NEC-BIFX-2020_002]